MLNLTEKQEKIRESATNLVMQRDKDYYPLGGDIISVRSVISTIPNVTYTDLPKGKDGQDLLGYRQSHLLLSITVPLAKTFFMVRETPTTKEDYTKCVDELATYIEKSTIRII